MIRITPGMFSDQLLGQLQTLQNQLNRYEVNIASGKRIHVPSDDPAGYRTTLELHSNQRYTQQLRNTSYDVITKANANYSAEEDLQTVVSRASEIVIKANGTNSATDNEVIASEINNLLERAISIANRTEGGQFMFGGTCPTPSDTDPGGVPVGAPAHPFVPFYATRDATSNEITAITFRGNEVQQQVEIEKNSTVASNVLGQSSSGAARGLFVNTAAVPGGPNNIFQTLIDIRDDLRAGTLDSAASVTTLRGVEDNVATILGQTSANLNRFEATVDTHTRSLQSDETTLSQVSDTDLNDAIVSLTRVQSALEAALQTGSQVLNLSLLNYL
ncbi:MAG: hypothetical protein PHV34_12295 [Verrucomicrobiae bacterium]|nr:hypothetical protein [Verrucomicrobiae bacterium]